MRVAVTGAAGRLGRTVMARLQDTGREVIGLDRIDPGGQGLIIVSDLCDLGQVCGVLADVDGVIHLGAIPAPIGHPPDVVFRNNVLGQFNVYEAAAILGINRVVDASSVSALGFPWQHRWSEPFYLPIDEAHPLLPQDAYGLSKAVGEQIAAAYCRRTGGSAVSLCFSTIVDVDGYRRFIDSVRARPSDFAPVLWSYTDRRDAVEACLLALTTPVEGYHPLFIVADDTSSEQATDVLLERYFPAVPRRPAQERPARWPLIDGTRAATVLRFHPRHRWQEMLDDAR